MIALMIMMIMIMMIMMMMNKVLMITTMIVMRSYVSYNLAGRAMKQLKSKQVYPPPLYLCVFHQIVRIPMHTSKLLELTFSNQTYTASLGFVAGVYFAETKTKGLAAKLWNVYERENHRTIV